MTNLSKDQKSLLLYLECRAVDQMGRVDAKHMNADDFKDVKVLEEMGLFSFGRIASEGATEHGAHWVKFTDEGYKAAAEERRDRAERNWPKRVYKTTEEKRGKVA